MRIITEPEYLFQHKIRITILNIKDEIKFHPLYFFVNSDKFLFFLYNNVIMKNLKRTPFYNEHKKLGAKLVPFAGWEMPVQYGSVIDEHLTVRNKVGLFDVSHMGEIFVCGAEAVNLLQKLVPQNISKLINGKAVYSQLVNKNAGIIDDLIIYRLEDKNNDPDFLLIVNASRVNEDYEWIEFNRKKFNFNAQVKNESEKYSLIAVQGPSSSLLLEDAGLKRDEQPEKFSIKIAELADSYVYISRTGYTGEDGFEIVIENSNAVKLWNELLEKGQKYEIKPIGLAARDTLRLEASMLLYGQDMDEKTTPIEASLGWSVPKDKQEDYYGKEIIRSQVLQSNFDKILIGFKMLDKSIPRHNCEIYKDNEKIGEVTSGGIAPGKGSSIGLGYINAKVSNKAGARFDIKIRDKFHPAEIIKRPFYSKKKG